MHACARSMCTHVGACTTPSRALSGACTRVCSPPSPSHPYHAKQLHHMPAPPAHSQPEDKTHAKLSCTVQPRSTGQHGGPEHAQGAEHSVGRAAHKGAAKAAPAAPAAGGQAAAVGSPGQGGAGHPVDANVGGQAQAQSQAQEQGQEQAQAQGDAPVPAPPAPRSRAKAGGAAVNPLEQPEGAGWRAQVGAARMMWDAPLAC